MRFPFALVYFLLLSTLAAQTGAAIRIDSAVTTYLTRTGFSGTILVAAEGEPVYLRTVGDSLTDGSRYAIASVTKLFTSIRILQLVDEGQIALDSPVVHYLPRYADRISAQLTPHHLLLHVSGLPTEADSLYTTRRSARDMVEAALNAAPAREPGSFVYNNVDYLLLGLLIEIVTGSGWQQNISEHILDPLGMSETGFLAAGNLPVRFAYPYHQTETGLERDSARHIENFGAAGAMYATVADLLKLDRALYTDVLLSPASRERLAVSYPEYNYVGYGVWNYRYPFVDAQPTVMERRGHIGGATCVLVRLTVDDYTIVILSNDDRFNPDSFGDDTNLREMLIRALY